MQVRLRRGYEHLKRSETNTKKQSIPEPELKEEELTWAVKVWEDPESHDPIQIRQALSVMRRWHLDKKDLLRRQQRGTPTWNDLKHEEELIETYMVDLKDALYTAMHMNKMERFG